MSRGLVVTIDGAAGTGKSTAARRLAEVLGWQVLGHRCHVPGCGVGHA